MTLRTPIAGSLGVSVVGAGRFANAVLLPALAKCSGVSLRGVVSAGGLSARTAARSFGFVFCTSDPGEVWRDAETRAVVIATRHAEHASMVGAAIRAGKAVFVEKPLCTTPEELNDLEALYAGAAEPPLVMVGFNRRFAPATRRILEHFAAVSGPLNIICRVNAGSVPRGSWVASPEHGGRIVGELCHFVDLCAVIARSRVRMVQALRTPGTDDVAVTLSMANGSLASIAYCCDGDRSFSKERIEVFGGSRVAVIDDFRGGVIVGHARRTRLGGLLQRQDKGHSTEIAAFVDAALGHRPNSVPFAEAVAATRATFAVLDALACAAPVTLDA